MLPGDRGGCCGDRDAEQGLWVSFRVDELDCAEEVSLLRQELADVPGVHELQFDLLHSKLTVRLDPQRLSSRDIAERIHSLGMHARPWEAGAGIETGTGWRRDRRLHLSACAAAGLLAGFLVHVALTGDLRAAWGLAAVDGATVPAAARLCYGLSIVCGLWLVVPRAWGAARRLRPDMNLLMTLAVAGAVLLGEWLEAASVALLFSVALLLEHWSLGRARRAIAALMDLSPQTARCVHTHAGREHTVEVRVESVGVGEIVRVHPGERIPLDGQIVHGATLVDEASITGESIPVAKQVGDEVFASTINQDRTFDFRVNKPAGQTMLARILHLVEAAQSRRAPSEQWVETFARYYTPAMLAVALAVAALPPLLLSADWTYWAYNALVVLVIACPCALVISTPVSIISGLTSATRHGVLIKGGRFLEAAARLEALALDKTGTLTYGRPVVEKVIPLNGHTRRELLERAAALEAHSRHPLARAILERAADEQVPIVPPANYRLLAGLGAEGEFSGRAFWIGSHRLLHERVEEPPEVHSQALALEDAGHTVVAVGNAQHVCGLIGLADRIRHGAAQSIAALKHAGVREIVMLTGDNEQTARAIARAAGLDHCHADLLPEDKVRRVETLRSRFRCVGMVGDGVNDAPAMAAADIGIAMGARGVDAAIETADIALMADDLTRLPWLIGHARRTVRIIRQNIACALGLKALFLALTLAGAASLWMAIAADMGASLLVIFNGMRLLRS